MVKLNSVGSILDTKKGIVYDQNDDGSPDLRCGVELEDCCEDEEWYDSLRYEDEKIVEECLNKLSDEIYKMAQKRRKNN